MLSMGLYAHQVRILPDTTSYQSLTPSQGNLHPLRTLPRTLTNNLECHPPIGNPRKTINKVIRERKGRV